MNIFKTILPAVKKAYSFAIKYFNINNYNIDSLLNLTAVCYCFIMNYEDINNKLILIIPEYTNLIKRECAFF